MDNFSQEKRELYLNENKQSLKGLLDDAFEEDQNQIRSEFPKACVREDLIIENTKVSMAYLNDSDTPIIEVALQVGYKEAPIAEYKSVYNASSELEDEFFYFE